MYQTWLCQRGWTRGSTEVPSNCNNSMILWIENNNTKEGEEGGFFSDSCILY